MIVKQVVTRGENCMVRVGGGYASVQEYYNNYSVKQGVQLFHIMNVKSQTFKQVVVDLMVKNSAHQETIEAYEHYDRQEWSNVNELFIMLTALLEARIKAQQHKHISPKKKKK